MLNVLSVDVEDYFHVEAFASKVRFDDWASYAPRVEQNVARILELFGKYGARGTFFVLGWVAEKFPNVVRDIAAAGHEIGCHGYAHRRLNDLTPADFRADIRRAVALLTDQIQRPIQSYRAPSFSIVPSTMWAFEVLAEEGFRIDSSIFPVRHDLYGVPDAERFPHWQSTTRDLRIFEFPPSTFRYRNRNWAVAGGGYLRLFPYGVTRRAIQHINQVEREPAMIYFHPWEIDPDQPRIRAGLRSTLRHYVNLFTTEQKIERLLQEFQFTTLSEVCAQHETFGTASRIEVVKAAAVAGKQ
jgi:polysaccharide deacetylase family protein (PEP-CTERM system associated)